MKRLHLLAVESFIQYKVLVPVHACVNKVTYLLVLLVVCSAVSNWKPGPHAVSTIVKWLLLNPGLPGRSMMFFK